jgi:hypothetical protein
MNAVARKIARRLTAAIRTAVQVSRTTLTAALTSIAALVRSIAKTVGFTTAQAASALELIEDNGIHHLRNQVWLTVSTDGTRTHRTTTNRCTCEAGIKGGRCYHSLAALVTEAA